MSLSLCCLSNECLKILTNEDNLKEHNNHKIVTTQEIINTYEKQRINFFDELKDGFYINQLENQINKQTQLLLKFKKELQEEIQQFQLNIIKQTNQLLEQLQNYNINLQQQEEILDCYKQIINNKLKKNDVQNLIKLIDRGENMTEKQLKEGLNDRQNSGSSITLNFDQKLTMKTPKQYYNLLYDQLKDKENIINYIFSQLQFLSYNFNYGMQKWNETVNQLLSSQDRKENSFIIMQQEKTGCIKGQQIQKIEIQKLFSNHLIFTKQQYLCCHNVGSLKKTQQIRFLLNINDFAVDSDKNFISILQGNDLYLYDLLSFKKIRIFKIQIDLSKQVSLKFFENQICVSSGVQLEFFPICPSFSMKNFVQSLNFHSYWDRINIVDYSIINKFGQSEMILIIGTIGGLILLFNSNFKELYSKQFHQGAILQFRYQQSVKFGKVLISTGEDMKVNVYQIENNYIRCNQSIQFNSQIQDILTFSNSFYVTIKNDSLLDVFQISEINECQKITIEGNVQLDSKDKLLNIGQKLIIIRNQILYCKIL